MEIVCHVLYIAESLMIKQFLSLNRMDFVVFFIFFLSVACQFHKTLYLCIAFRSTFCKNFGSLAQLV